MIDKGCPSLYRRLHFLGRNETGNAQMDIKPLSVFILLMTVARLLVKKTNKYCHLYLNRLDRGEWLLLQKVTSVLSQTNTVQTSDTPMYNTFADT